MDEMMEKNIHNIISCLCMEYQAVCTVEVSTGEMKLFKANSKVSKDLAGLIKTYDSARRWYIENCVVEGDRERLLIFTQMDNLLNFLKDNNPLLIDYKRLSDGDVNANQLYYAKLEEKDGEITSFIVGLRDVENIRHTEVDELTGLYTRQAFIHHAEKTLFEDPDTEYDLVMSDIVDFKQINETYGVKVGDRVLMSIAENLKNLAKRGFLVGRYGGDQFAILVNHEESLKMKTVIENRKPLQIDAHLPAVDVKYGINECINHNLQVAALCDRAHAALNSIKRQYGVKYAIYDDELREKQAKRRRIESDMHTALIEEQFKVYYQPKHDANTRKIVGAEALIRWIHPEYGFMSPADFIPLFETNGFIVESDFYVWKRTCDNIKRWESQGLDVVPVSVNSSRLGFENSRLLNRIVELEETHAIPRDYLHIEVTESLMTENNDELIRMLNILRNHGYKIELDDFGTGYSSINTLSTLPIDVVKLDMSFIQNLDDKRRLKVLQACVSLAKDLGYKTVSEGVENDEQLAIVRSCGVDTVQGYYYSKPLPEEEFEEYLKKAI